MTKHFDLRTFAVDTIYYIIGSALFGLGIYTFALNAHFATGGLTGISLIINFMTGWPIGTLSILLNLPIILATARTLGSTFIVKSVWGIIILTVFLDVIYPHIPTYSGDPFLACIFAGILSGAGLSFFYMRASSSGGLDFIITSVRKKRPQFSIGRLALIINIIIIVGGSFVFGSIDAVLYGVIFTFAQTMSIDRILYGLGSGKMALIVTDHAQKIADSISLVTRRGSTIFPATGSYTGKKREVLMCVCGKSQIYKIRFIARTVDPGSIVIITEANEILGEGFKAPNIVGSEDPSQKPTPSASPQKEKATQPPDTETQAPS